MASTRGVYFFDEFDAIGSKRAEGNDVGEIRRVLNSFLQFLEQDDSQGLIIAATNHAELLDKALFRRFDDVIEYGLPDVALINRIFKNRLAAFDTKALVWDELSEAAMGLSPAEIVRAAENAAKSVLLAGGKSIVSSELVASIVERRKASFLNAT